MTPNDIKIGTTISYYRRCDTCESMNPCDHIKEVSGVVTELFFNCVKVNDENVIWASILGFNQNLKTDKNGLRYT